MDTITASFMRNLSKRAALSARRFSPEAYIATRSAGIDHSLGLPKARPKQASGDRHRCTKYPGRDYLVTVGGFIS